MKCLVQVAFPVLLVLGLSACGSKREQPADPTATPAAAEAAAPASPMANLDALPVSTADLGAFPFFSLPDGFAQSDASERALEQKYVFPGGGLLIIEGRYHHARILAAEGSEWNETLLLRSFNDRIKALGGVQVFDGRLPDAARAKIAADSPRFVSDLYDPSPYRFRQYVIRTPQGRVWIEIGYGYNAEMADLTIVQEGPLRQTITQVTADAPGT